MWILTALWTWSHLYVLIDTWWNVNYAMMVVISYQIRVLIDTWWNVNDATPKTLDDIYKVLIDTWWNVNYSVESVFASGLFSFNRYMVECEWTCYRFAKIRYICFNRYMVECEYRCVWGFSMVHQRFNRYMVECEFLHGLITLSSQPCVLIDTWWNVNKIDDIYISFRTLF